MSAAPVSPLFAKLNYKGQAEVYLLNAPASFEVEVAGIAGQAKVQRQMGDAREVQYALLFATRQQEVDDFATRVAELSAGDAVVWVAYPKQSSKRYRCEFNRDTGWARFGELGFEPVRQVAIDEDWSALRFRRVEHIQKMTRAFAMTAEGKQKASRGRK